MRAKRVRCRKAGLLLRGFLDHAVRLLGSASECSQNAHDPVVDVRGRPGVLLWHGLGHSCRGGMGGASNHCARRQFRHELLLFCEIMMMQVHLSRRAKTPENHDDLMAVADCKQLKVVTMLNAVRHVDLASMQIGRIWWIS